MGTQIGASRSSRTTGPWKPYGSSHCALASLIAIGIYSGNEVIGIFSTRLPPETFPVVSAKDLWETSTALSGILQDYQYGKPKDAIPPAQTRCS